MNEKHRELMVKCFMASGRTQSQAEELYDRTYEAKKPIAKPVPAPVRRSTADDVVAAPVRVAEKKIAPQTPAPVTQDRVAQRTKTEHTVKFSLLERITATLGEPCAYDGRYCVWITKDNGRTRDSLDVRDIAGRMHTTADAVVDCLPSFAPVRRGRAAESPEDDNE